jgi:hypothetical protein
MDKLELAERCEDYGEQIVREAFSRYDNSRINSGSLGILLSTAANAFSCAAALRAEDGYDCPTCGLRVKDTSNAAQQ